jgi:hypothetical protein
MDTLNSAAFKVNGTAIRDCHYGIKEKSHSFQKQHLVRRMRDILL